ncbi:unnamed protein product [Cladocopium goreaui]|uniref:SET domain-containing protein n=1 Tax=Cladocopium goreaui TaxID=2562237 RepID=A0A9P1G167_9DINO|nr:unnamed protein product [Cladocopium goreaui]
MQPCTVHIGSISELLPAGVRVQCHPKPHAVQKEAPLALAGLVGCNAFAKFKIRRVEQSVQRRFGAAGAAYSTKQSAIAYDEESQCLRAMLNLSAGEVLLEESPLVLLEDSAEGVDDLGSEEDLWRGFRRHRCFKAADTFKLLDADARTAVLSLYTPASENQLQDWSVEQEAAGGDPEVLRFLQVLRVNGIEVPFSFTGLYNLACRANHSCAPCCRVSVAEGGQLRIVALRPILAGDEVTVSYLSELELLEVGSVRRKMLETTWDFRCTCSRCSAPDDRRSTLCRACIGAGRPSGLVALQTRTVQLGGATAELESWSVCSKCGAVPEASVLTESENIWVRRYEQLPSWCRDSLRSFLAPKAPKLSIAAIEEVAQSLADMIQLHRDFAQVEFLEAHWLAADIAGASAAAGLLLYKGADGDRALSDACKDTISRLELKPEEISRAAEKRLQAVRGVFGEDTFSVEAAQLLRLKALAADIDGPGGMEPMELRRRSFEIALPLLPPGKHSASISAIPDKDLTDDFLYDVLLELAE